MTTRATIGSMANFGVAIRGPEVASNDSSWRMFASGNTLKAPYLTIDCASTTGHTASGATISTLASSSTLAGSEGASSPFAPMQVSTAGCTADDDRTQKCRVSWHKEMAQ